jgi:nucleolar protein 14
MFKLSRPDIDVVHTQRKASLLPEHNLRRTAHTGAFIDRRFGESDPTITPEQRALERFTRQQELERRSGSSLSKKSRFNLNDDDDTGFGMGFGDDDGDHIGISKLTHGGRTIDELKGDDFAAQGLDDDDDDLEDDFGLENTRRRAEASGAIDRNTVKRSHFGGFGEEGDEEEVSYRLLRSICASVPF